MAVTNEQLFIPTKLSVGFQNRSDTYTGKLAYVTYFDTKGKLCKEKSWRGWIHDKPRKINTGYELNDKGQPDYYKPILKEVPGIPIQELENVPTEGFVLNKKVGGYSSGWNHRQIQCRVYDPRGFEFEIGMENLLFILQESNSYKGKGLEGEFVYAWHGANLVLLPCSGLDYKSSKEFTDLKTMSVNAKTLKEGRTYYTKDQEKVVYIGKYDYIQHDVYKTYGPKRVIDITKEHIFLTENKKNDKNVFIPLKATKLGKILVEECIDNYAELVTELESSGMVLPVERIDIVPVTDIFELLQKDRHQTGSGKDSGYYYHNNNAYSQKYFISNVVKKTADNKYESYSVYQLREWTRNNHYGNNGLQNTHIVRGYIIKPNCQVYDINGNNIAIKDTKAAKELKEEYRAEYSGGRQRQIQDPIHTEAEINAMELIKLRIKIKNQDKLKVI